MPDAVSFLQVGVPGRRLSVLPPRVSLESKFVDGFMRKKEEPLLRHAALAATRMAEGEWSL